MARPGLERHPKFKRLVRTLGIPKPYCRGLLETLWDVAYECGNAIIGDEEAVEAAAEWPGEPGQLFDALLNAGGQSGAGFIEKVPDDIHNQTGHVRFQVRDLFDHAPEYVKKRHKREQERSEKTRKKSKRQTTADNGGQCPENGNTPAPAPAPNSNTPLPPFAPDVDTPRIRQALCDWLAYRGKAFKPRGLKALVTRLEKRIRDHGEQAVLDAIERAMSASYKGWDFDEWFAGKTKPANRVATPADLANWHPTSGVPE